MSESETRSEHTSQSEEPQQADGVEAEMSCDFCGESVVSVRRVALDGEYDRLRPPHQVRYACASCSERKDRERAERESGAG